MGPGQGGVYPEFVESLIELFNFLKKQCNFLMTLKKKKTTEITAASNKLDFLTYFPIL